MNEIISKMDSLNKLNPQKGFVKTICLVLYYVGVGNCWHEPLHRTDLQRLLYLAWMAISNLYNVSFTVNIYLAYYRSDLDDKERNDLVQFTIAHGIIMCKIVSFYVKSDEISKFLSRLLEDSRSSVVTDGLDKACVRKSVVLCVTIGVCVYVTMLATTFDAIRAHIRDESQFEFNIANMNLSRKNPQKTYVKMICSILYYSGTGDCWYELSPKSRIQKHAYQIWRIVTNFYIFSFLLNEFLAHTRADLTDHERNDLVQFTIAHSVISFKIIFLYIDKKRIIKVLRRLLENNYAFVTRELDRECVKKTTRLCITVTFVSYMALLTYTIDGIRAHLAEGIPIRTEVTFYPAASESGLLINILRFFVQFHWWFAVTIMAAIDCLCISSLVIVGYKFKVLEVYFSNLREKVFENSKSRSKNELENEFKNDFVIGIKMHDDALWCAKNVQRALGSLYSVQIFESVALLVMCLIKLVTVDRNLIFLLANSAYIFCLIMLTGAYMLPAGDITHEAAMVSTWMFHSGWELVSSRDVRVLAVLALQRSQVPVVMSAFGILTLSYSNFISVIRSSYSFFAVMY